MLILPNDADFLARNAELRSTKENMQQYLDLGRRIQEEGKIIEIGKTRRLTIFGAQMRFDLSDNYMPVITTKRLAWRWVVEELIWFLNGSTNVKELEAVGVPIWTANAKPDGTIGDAYGHQWRNWNDQEYDQIANCLHLLKTKPKSTRNVVMAWNPLKVDSMALPPCHFSFQCLVDRHNKLTLEVTMRSVDFCVGLPFNIASYGLLLRILAESAGLKPGELIMDLSHVHVYEQHLPTLAIQLNRLPFIPPGLIRSGELTPDLKGLRSSQFTLESYQYDTPLPYEMVVT